MSYDRIAMRTNKYTRPFQYTNAKYDRISRRKNKCVYTSTIYIDGIRLRYEIEPFDHTLRDVCVYDIFGTPSCLCEYNNMYYRLHVVCNIQIYTRYEITVYVRHIVYEYGILIRVRTSTYTYAVCSYT